MQAAEADLRALAEGEAGTLRVGTFQSVGVRVLPRVMRLYMERRPGIEVRLAEFYFDDLVLRLASGELELAFVSGPLDAATDHVEVMVDPYVLLVPAGSELARAGRQVGLRELARLPLVAYRRPEEFGEAHLRAKGIDPNIVFRSDESGIVQGLVGAGVGNALVPLLTVDKGDLDVAILDVHGIPPREISLAWHADRTLSPAARAFVEVVTEVVAGLGEGR
jgi:DNA-binding transcriptional LysR family regulator